MKKYRILFVDDENNILQAIRRMLHGKRDVWEMSFVDSGQKALELLDETPHDVLVSDVMMPGMDGVELLEKVMERHPETARIVLSGQVALPDVVRSVRSAHQYIAKPCEKQALITRIEGVLDLRKHLTKPDLQQLLNGLDSLPVLPDIYASVAEELEKEEVSLNRVGDIISQDVSICTKILKLINSPFFGLRAPVKDIHQAVAYLGIEPLRALILSAQLFLEYENTTFDGFALEMLWEHSLRVSQFSSIIAAFEGLEGKNREACSLAGLLHDVGKMVLLANRPDEYAQVLEKVREGSRPHEAELEVFGATHSQVSGYLMGLWGLPTDMVRCIIGHHGDNGEASDMPVKIVLTANLIDHSCIVINKDYDRPDLDTLLKRYPDILERLPAWREELKKKYDAGDNPLVCFEM